MDTMTAQRSVGRFTRADLEAMPDDGNRYELLDGAIIVTPSPGVSHQRVVTRVLRALDAAAVPGTEVFAAPLDTHLPTGDILEPDVLVVDPEGQPERFIQSAPLLAVEVLSPSSRRRDVGDKLTAYRDAGVPSYWVVDPDVPRLLVWALRDGEYVEVADVSGDEEWTAEAPYAATVRPADLVSPRW